MTVKVLNEFVDKHTGELHKKGSSFLCSKERYKEIKESGNFVEVVPEKKEKTRRV